MGTVDAGLSGRRPTETVPGAGDEPLPFSARLGAKGAWNGAWQALNTPVGVVLSVVVAFGSVLGILMSVFLGELRAMEQRLRQDMAAMEERLQAQITELRIAHLQGALGAEADGEPPGPGPSQGAAPKAGAGASGGHAGDCS